MSTDKLVLQDMTPESLIRYAYKCLDKCREKGRKFDWREYTTSTTCCLGGAIRLQNSDAFYVAYKLKENNVKIMSSACRQAQHKFHTGGWRELPTPEEVLQCWNSCPTSSENRESLRRESLRAYDG